jgi:hypothetical protein
VSEDQILEREQSFFIGQLLHISRAIQFAALFLIYYLNYLTAITSPVPASTTMMELLMAVFVVGSVVDIVFVVQKHKWRAVLIAGVVFAFLGVWMTVGQWTYFRITLGVPYFLMGLSILFLSAVDIVLWLSFRRRGSETELLSEFTVEL